jgi:hypothetical protein
MSKPNVNLPQLYFVASDVEEAWSVKAADPPFGAPTLAELLVVLQPSICYPPSA